MDCKVVVNKKDCAELEFTEKDIPIALVGALQKNGVDAYWYEPHPLKQEFRVHVDSDDPLKAVKKAVKDMESDVGEFRKAVEAKLK